MKIQNQIIEKIKAALLADYLDVVNESHMHSVPEKSETHFKVTIVSDEFLGQRQVARHQRIYKLLADELNGEVHALALHIHTGEEWSRKGKVAPASPNCLGGSKQT